MKALAIMTLAIVGSVCAHQGGGSVWEPSAQWAQQANQALVSVTGLDVDREGRIYICGGTQQAVHVLDGNGNEVARWGDFVAAKHGLRVFNDKVYVTDIGNHVVYECTLQGEVLRTFGTVGEAGEGPKHFNKPTDVCVAPDGSIYVSDGYGNSRIVCLSPQGEFRFAWGQRGNGPSEFFHPHNLVIAQGRVYVADRDNRRIQVFDSEGKFLEQWNHVGQPFGLALGEDGLLYVSSVLEPGRHGVLVLTPEGRLVDSFGRQGSAAGEFDVPHSLALGAGAAEMYVGEVANARVQLWVKGTANDE